MKSGRILIDVFSDRRSIADLALQKISIKMRKPAAGNFMTINKVEICEREWGELYDEVDLRVYVVY